MRRNDDDANATVRHRRQQHNRGGADRRGCRRLGVGALILVGAVAAASTTAVTAVVARPCVDEEAVMYRCMYGSNLLAAMECEACLSNSVPTKVNYCHELNNSLQAVPKCPCAPCGPEILSYVTCALHNVTGCTLNDSDVALQLLEHEPTSVACEGLGCALQPSPDLKEGTNTARSNLVACQSERAEYGTCLQSSSSSTQSVLEVASAALACEQCLAAHVPLPGTGASCENYQFATCSALAGDCQDACVDVGCVPELETYVSCSVTNQMASSCDIGCGPSDPAGSDARYTHQGCSDQVDALNMCLETYEAGSGRVQACPNCVSNAFMGSNVSGVACDTLSEDVCPSLQQCDCGSCGDYVESYFACVAYATTPSCNKLECNTTSTPLMDDDDNSNMNNNSTTDDGGSGSGGGDSTSPICNSQFVSLRQCLLTDEIGTDLYDTCPACVNDSFPNGTDASTITCDAMNTDVCRNMKSCDCGSCQSLVGQYFDCVAVMTPASCTQVSYDTCFGFPVSPTTATTPTAATPSSPVAVATPTLYPSTSPVPSASPVPTPTSGISPAPTTASSLTSSPSRSVSGPPVTPGACADKQRSMQVCLRDELTVSEQDCLTCVDAIDKAVQSPTPDCSGIESSLCEVVSGVCRCGACTASVNSYFTCAAAQEDTNCTVSCPTQPPASAPGGSTSGALPVAHQYGLLRWSGVALFLLSAAPLL